MQPPKISEQNGNKQQQQQSLHLSNRDNTVPLRSQLIVFGFTRDIQSLLTNHIPAEIVTVTLSYYGDIILEFIDFGVEFGNHEFITTDFDQLSRGHTQWVNQVMFHPLQSGIAISASDDWCVIFWRFGNVKENEQTSLNKNKQEHIEGEIDLLPALKINTGLEVKGIAMSSNGEILACSCYDEEEDEGQPEIQLYYDKQKHWRFIFPDKQSQRAISRTIISLPFEPVFKCLCFSGDNKYVFVAMYSSVTILKELNDELEEEYGDKDVPSKYLDHAVSLCCINVNSKEIKECQEIQKYLKDDEHVAAIRISTNSEKIAIGTSVGQLMVTRVINLSEEENEEEELYKVWSSDSNEAESVYEDENENGSITAISWNEDDEEWIICGHASGLIKIWTKNDNMFECKWRLQGLHIEAINSLSIRKSIMVSGADDGNVLIYDLLAEFIADKDNMHHSTDPIARFNKISGGRMVNSVCLEIMQNYYETVSLSQKYTEDNLVLPSNAFFMIESGANNTIRCVSLLKEVYGQSIQKYLK